MASRSWSAALLLMAAGCTASVGSIGAVLGRDNESQALYVRDVPRGLAAERAGLIPGDELVMIDGVYVRDLSSAQLRDRLRGAVGSAVEITVVRGSDVRRVRVVRSELKAHEGLKPREEQIVP
ncbi:PDZ domain-containing protein [Sorangium sp. So ce1014]|uniref:PDZ domain-containing protein n=1 Tax=Sorangium sp. So ce1014 TaxID=3133326 RepID=UPI003F6018D9